MAIYLYNLIFSLNGTDVNAGRFQPYPSVLPPNPSIANLSCAWFTYTATGTPSGLQPYYQPVSQALTPSQWGNPQSDANAVTLDPGDYAMLRVSSADANVSHYLARLTGVFGRGTSQLLPTGAGDLQSPLVMTSAGVPSSTLPRAVIDSDASAATSWPGPITSDGSWVLCLGAVCGAPGDAANDYTVNVGASVFVTQSPPSAGNLFTFGHDPRMHVTGQGFGTKFAA